MITKVHLIFSGYNQRAVIAFLRTLIKNNEHFAIIAKSESDLILKTNYNKNVITIREKVELDLNDIINSINKVKNKIIADEYIIAPSTEALNRFILRHRKEFLELGCLSPLVDEKLYELLSDKYSFCELCVKNKIDVPLIYHSFNDAKIPVVAKPYKYFSSNGLIYSPVLIFNENDKINFIKNFSPFDFFYQKYIQGRSLYLLYYFHRNGDIYKYSQENIGQQPNGKSIIAAIPSEFHLSSESLKYEQMLRENNYYGFIMIEVRKIRSKNYMIEANPRFWGPSQLFVDVGANFFEAYLNDYGTLNTPPVFSKNNKRIKYFWFGGVLETYRKKQKPLYHRLDENSFLLNLSKWLKHDVYNRYDTIEIFKKEIEHYE